VLFRLLRLRHALLTSMIGGWLFLPVAGFPVTGLHTKISCVATVLAVPSIAAAPHLWRKLRPRLFDLPAAVWCLWPI
jgi:hypothetical protein